MSPEAVAVSPDGPGHDLLADVEGLLNHLRARGLRLSVGDDLRLLAVRDSLRRSGVRVGDAAGLFRWVAPVVCRDPEQQAGLAPILEAWADQSGSTPSARQTETKLVRDLEEDERRRKAYFIVTVMAVAVSMMTDWALWRQRHAIWLSQPTPVHIARPAEPLFQKRGPAVPKPASHAPALADLHGVKPATPPAINTWDFKVRMWPLLFVLAPILLVGGLILARRRASALLRGLAPVDPRRAALEIAVGNSPLFRAEAIRAALRDLRRPYWTLSVDIDVKRSVAATVASAGFIQVIRARRAVIPEHVLLIDRITRDDHLGGLGDVLAERLRTEHVRVTRADFRGDPRRLDLVRRDGGRRPTDLARLARDHGDARLLVLADVASLWDAARADWRGWVADLAAFGDTTILTPTARTLWSRRERDLAARGLRLVPATSRGLADLSGPGEPPGPSGAAARGGEALESLLETDPYRWSADTPPGDRVVVELLEALKATLGPSAFLHLCAIAVFPSLHPRLTARIGERLTTANGAPVLTEESFAAMSRLPWLRRGRIPDWLRKTLIEAMTKADAARVRSLWTRELEPAPAGKESRVSLEVVLPAGAEARLRQLIIRLIRGGDALDLNEAILLAFLEGRKLPDLAVAAPRRLVRAGPFLFTGLDRLDAALIGLGAAVALCVGLLVTGPSPIARPGHAPPPAPLLARGQRPAPFQAFRDCADCLDMVALPGGTFTMGSPKEEPGRGSDEDQVSVTLPGFAVSRFPVTRGQYAAFVAATGRETEKGCGTAYEWVDGMRWIDTLATWRDPGFAQDDSHPVVCLNWDDAVAYAAWMKTRTGQDYRLLSEAEYEYAERAGTTTAYFWGDDANAGCAYANLADATAKRAFPSFDTVTCDDGYERTSPVGHFAPNPWGLFDIDGDVWSWTADCYAGSYQSNPKDGRPYAPANCDFRVLHGGPWDASPRSARAAFRDNGTPTYRGSNVGFRLARTLSPPPS